MPKKSIASTRSISYFPVGRTEAVLLSIEETLSLLGMTAWVEEPLPPVGETWSPALKSALASYQKKSLRTQEKLAIVHMPAPLEAQFEMMAVKPIRKGEIILYTGDYHREVAQFDPYAYGEKTWLVTAKNRGNLARLLAHAPTREYRDQQMVFDSEEIKDKIATANFTGGALEIAGRTIYCLIAAQDIEPGQRLYWDYGKNYFYGLRQAPLLFDKATGQVIPDSHYDYVDPTIYFGDKAKMGQTSPASLAQLHNLIERDAYFTISLRTYDLYCHASYLAQLLERYPSLTKKPFAEMPIPYEAQIGLKRLPKETDLRQVSLALLGSVLTDQWVEDAWRQVAVQLASDSSKPTFCELTTISKNAYLAMEQKLTAAGFVVNQDYGVIPAGAKYHLFVRQSALFERLDSTVDYYPDLASHLVDLGQVSAQWLPSVTRDHLWLVAKLTGDTDPQETRDALQALAAHVNQHCQNKGTEKQAVCQDQGAKVLLTVPVEAFPDLPPFQWVKPIITPVEHADPLASMAAVVPPQAALDLTVDPIAALNGLSG